MKVAGWFLMTVFLTATPGVAAEGDTPSPTEASATRPAVERETPVSVFKYTNRQGVVSFSDRAPVNRNYRVIQVNPGCYACNMKSTVDWYSTPLHLNSYRTAISRAASQHRIDPALIRAVIHAESAFKADAKSSAGALGLMQLMPGTARDMGVADPLSPDANINGGVRYLAYLLQKTGGDITLATAAYNAGPGAVERYRGIPPYKETQTYVRRVRILHDRYRRALSRAT